MNDQNTQPIYVSQPDSWLDVTRPIRVRAEGLTQLEVELHLARLEDKPVLRNLLELYAYDFSEYEDLDVDEHGLFGYGYLDYYWTEIGRYPYLVRVGGKLVGFVMVRSLNDSNSEPVHGIAEFFIMKKYRHQGIGKITAWRIFDTYPGRWIVTEIARNTPAQAFWRKIIGEYTLTIGITYEERANEDGDGPNQTFVNSK
jgi:predicted acetyltransferase